MSVEDLRNKVLEAQTNSDIASLYVLEQQAHDTFDEETLQKAFMQNILDFSLRKSLQIRLKLIELWI